MISRVGFTYGGYGAVSRSRNSLFFPTALLPFPLRNAHADKLYFSPDASCASLSFWDSFYCVVRQQAIVSGVLVSQHAFHSFPQPKVWYLDSAFVGEEW